MNPQGHDPYESPPWLGSLRQPSGPGPPSGTMPPQVDLSLLKSLPPQEEGRGGWDFNFSPPLDSKYECPICLMCLRDPWQTSCGHRFCKVCIQRSLREAGPRCPVDNKPLSEQTMFRDEFAKREIMSLEAFCPFKDKGCPEKIELRLMVAHEEHCRFGTIKCPNLCSQDVRRLSYEEHVRVLCPKIPVVCEQCGKRIAKDMLEKHKENCTKGSIQCQHCGKTLLREEAVAHIEKSCPKVVIVCRFKTFGCQAELLRERMDLHMKEAVHQHMALLASGLESVNLVGGPQRSLDGDDYGDYSGLPNNSLSLSTDYTHSGVMGAGALGKGEKGFREEGERQSYSSEAAAEFSKGGGGIYHSGSGGLVGPPPPMPSLSLSKDSYSAGDLGQYLDGVSRWMRSAQERDRRQQKKINDLEQRLLVLERSRKAEAAHATSRLCNGVYVWRLRNYGRMRDDAVRGATSVQHSDGFYTSPYGYKLCIRVNVNATDGVRGAYISLFIHFMKGEYDDLVEWPFRGSIALSILDQSANPEKRKHLRETLVAKSELLAFQRPTSYRNHKGFGYMEFAPLSVLENGAYIKDDSFFIKVEVKKERFELM